jgi:tetratricopeptide (TPR) repeat protein
LVVAAGPHDSGAPVPYHPIRSLVLSLLHAEASDLPAFSESATDPIVAAGFAELAEPVGLRGSDGASRAGAVACALAHALREGLSDLHAKRAVLVVDDLDRCDLLSAQTLRLLPRHADDVPVLVLAVVSAGAQGTLVPDMNELSLRGLSAGAAQALSLGEPQPLYEREDEQPGLLPLYLEQLRRLGMTLGASTTLPTRLADAFAQRTQRLDAGARRLLQAICVKGVACDRIAVARMVSSDDLASLDALESGGFVSVVDDRIEVEHPYLRDLVEASTPAETRKQLHARALELSTQDEDPLEVRAHHAYGAGEPATAMRLLEEMGDRASARGDAATAVLAFRRGLELVRRELLESGDVSLEDTIASISRRLGVALARRGDLMGAEGVLREALELSGPLSAQRAFVLMELGRVLGRRRRGRDAHRMFGQALELATQLKDAVAQAEAHVGIAELRYAESGTEAALEPLATAEALLDSEGVDPLQVARLAVRRAELSAERSTESGDALARAREVVGLAASPYLEARVHELASRLARARGELDAAEAARARAQATAARAGDASGVLRHLTDSMPASMRPPSRAAGAAGSS